MRLGVNIDHVATLRNARGDRYPDLMRAAEIVKQAGGDLITIHLREDRRHIKDEDAMAIIQAKILPVNLEIAATDEMLAFALKYKPHYVCFVPEKREEITTEGGLDLLKSYEKLEKYTKELQNNKINVSFFIEADSHQIHAAKDLGANAIELHTGSYASAQGDDALYKLEKIQEAAVVACHIGLNVHAGHGLSYDNVEKIAAIKEIEELNIGHFLISEAIFIGLDNAIKKMISIIKEKSE